MEQFLENYISYKHYPSELANREVEQSREKHFKVTTINWTYATENGLAEELINIEPL